MTDSIARFCLLLPLCWGGLIHAAPVAEHLSLGLSRLPHQRDLLFPDQKYWQHELNLKWNVGWEYETGVRVVEGLDVIWHHHSQHTLDWERETFPVSDSYGIRITFLDK